jgi:LysR family pca operon transcriptional activator
MSIDQRIKFRHLQCFLEVARQGSVVKAADILGITQPAVSKTLKELEETLDVSLFDRSTRGARLTPFGDVFLRHAGASVAALRQGVDGIAQVRNRGGATITLGALPTVSAGLIPTAILAYKKRAVGTTVCVITGDNATLLAALRVGEVDLVVGRLAEPEQMKGLAFEHLYTESVRFVVRPGHPLARKPGFALADILDYTVLMPSGGSIIRPSVDRLLLANGIGAVADRIETVSMPFGRRYARMSDAVWIISNGVVADDIASGYLVALKVDTAITNGPVGLTTRVDQTAGVAVLMLMQAIREAAHAPEHDDRVHKTADA